MRNCLLIVGMLTVMGCVRPPTIQFATFVPDKDRIIWLVLIGLDSQPEVTQWVQTSPNVYDGFGKNGQKLTTQNISSGTNGYYASRATFWNVHGRTPTIANQNKPIRYDWCSVEYNSSCLIHGNLSCFKDDKVLLSAYFKNGNPHGKYQTFHENGQPLGSALFSDPDPKDTNSSFTMLGHSREWDANGQLLIDVKFDNQGKEIYQHHFRNNKMTFSKYPRGSGNVIRRFALDGKLTSYEEYYENVRRKVTFNEDGTIAKCVLPKIDDNLRPYEEPCKTVPSLKQMQQPTIAP